MFFEKALQTDGPSYRHEKMHRKSLLKNVKKSSLKKPKKVKVFNEKGNPPEGMLGLASRHRESDSHP